MTLPLVSIIIVNYNGKDYLEKCLESLLKINYKNIEIIVVDNHSIDGSIEFLETYYPQIKIKRLDKNYGFAYPNNLGSKMAQGEFLLFLNNDTTVTPSFLLELVEYMNEHLDVGICQSLLLKPNGDVDSSGDFVDSNGICFSSKEHVNQVTEILSAKGASMLVRKEIFSKLGGFDEKFFITFEDVDLGWRTWIIGYRVVIVPTSVVYHYGGGTIKKIDPGIAFHGFKNQLSMRLTNFEFTSSFKALLYFFVVYGVRSLRVYFDYKTKGSTSLSATKYESITAKEPNFKGILKSIWWIIKNTNYIVQKRRLLSKNRVFSSQELVQKKVLKQ